LGNPERFHRKLWEAGIERVHFMFALSCHSNATHALIANLPNTAQLGGTPYHSPKLHSGPCNSVGMRRGTDRQTQTRVNYIHFALSTTHVKGKQAKISSIQWFDCVRNSIIGLYGQCAMFHNKTLSQAFSKILMTQNWIKCI